MPDRLFHITEHKCGSQWVRDVLASREIISTTGYRHIELPVDYFDGTIWTNIPDKTFSSPVYSINALEWNTLRSSGDRAIVVLRDPRDRIVSLYFSLMYSHSSSWSPVSIWRKILSIINDEEIGLMSLFTDTRNCLCRDVLTWASYNSPEVLVLRYEQLIEDQYSVFRKILDWLGWNVDRKTLESVVNSMSFEVRSGRSKGDTDVASHYRRAVAGDWRNHFSREVGKQWEQVMPGVLTKSGYENSDDWWKTLPEQSPQTQIKSESQVSSQLSIQQRRIESLENMLNEKESVIRELAAAADERLTLIEQLDHELHLDQSDRSKE